MSLSAVGHFLANCKVTETMKSARHSFGQQLPEISIVRTARKKTSQVSVDIDGQ